MHSFTVAIKDYDVDSEEKLNTAYEILAKAFGRSIESQSNEISPYRSIRELEELVKKTVEDDLYLLYKEIKLRWLRLTKAESPFKLSGKIYLNPRTGRPLTKSQWAIIKKDLMRAFGYIYRDKDELLIKTAMALGKVLKSMKTTSAINTPLKTISLAGEARQLPHDPAYRAGYAFAQEHMAENIVELTNRQFKAIHDVTLQAYVDRKSPQRLQVELFEKFGEMNRDWRRIADTEIATATNNGQLISMLESTEEDYTFVKGLSSAEACDFCATQVHEHIFALVSTPPEDGSDQVTIKGKKYTAIWIGKNNVGRRKVDWWVAAGCQHPHCRCSFVSYTPGFEKEWDQLSAAMESASKEAKRSIYNVPEHGTDIKPLPKYTR